MSYIDDHPTHYNVRQDIARLNRRLIVRHGGSWNTYYNHPPPFWLDATSVDHWGPGGRGTPLGLARGNAILNDIYYDPNPPWIRWYIWQGYIWIDGIGRRWHSGDDGWSDAGHFRHAHITYW